MALRAICLWPGLPAAWMLGVSRSLLVALVFAWSICGLLLATFVWPDWIAVSLLRMLWLTAIATWIGAAFKNCLRLPGMLATSDAHSSLALAGAQQEYLRGNWFEAEASILQILHDHPRDAEAMLLLVGILRRTRRFQPALRRLGQLERLETAAVWHFEIQREKGWIARAMADDSKSFETEGPDEVANDITADEADEQTAEMAV